MERQLKETCEELVQRAIEDGDRAMQNPERERGDAKLDFEYTERRIS